MTTLDLDRIEIESAGSDPVRLARALLAQLQHLTGRVPVREIALALDIAEVVEAPLERLEGCLQTDRRKSRGQIVVNARSSPRRRRFSIGHELGHFLNERHRPTEGHRFACTAEDMRSPVRSGRHLVQERDANTFAIEVLTPRHLLDRHLRPLPDLEHALAISKRFDISRAAAVRRYVELHDSRLAAVFSKAGRITWIDKPDGFPATTVWCGDVLPERPDPPGDGSNLAALDAADADAWLMRSRGIELVQTLFQQDGHAVSLLLAGPAEEDLPQPRFRRSIRKP